MRRRSISILLAVVSGFLVSPAHAADRNDDLNPVDARSVSPRSSTEFSESSRPRRRIRRSRSILPEDALAGNTEISSVKRKSYRVVDASESYQSPHVILDDIQPEIIDGPSLEYSSDCLSCEPEWSQDWGDCCPKLPVWAHRPGVFVEYLFLRPANADYVYSVETTGPDPDLDSPTGPVGIVGTKFESGARGGFTWALNNCSSIVATYTWFESGSDDFIYATPGNVLAAQPTHPSVANAGATSIESSARQSIDFELADIMYRHAFYHTDRSAINYSAGVRFARLEQDFNSRQIIGVATGLTTVDTQIDFDGFGLGFGLDAERHHACRGWFVYGKGGVSFLGGEYKANFRQVNQLGGSAVIGNSLNDYRVVSIVESEVGAGWQSRCGNWRFTAGYLVQGWFNTLTSSQYIEAVKTTQYDDVGETLAFNGLTSRLEWRY